MSRPRWRPVLAALLLAVLFAGCKVDTTVNVVVKENGSGEVRVRAVLDAAAVAAAESNGGKLDDRVRLGDLTSAGWKVAPWARALDGTATLLLVKPFVNVSQVNAIIRELNGADGPLREVHVTRKEKIGTINFAFRGTADLAAMKTGVLADPALVASLTAQQVDVRRDRSAAARRAARRVHAACASRPGGPACEHVEPEAGNEARDALVVVGGEPDAARVARHRRRHRRVRGAVPGCR